MTDATSATTKRATGRRSSWQPSHKAGPSHAADEAGKNRTSVYREMEKDPAFFNDVADAERQSADVREAEARRRATEGVTRVRTHQGAVITASPAFVCCTPRNRGRRRARLTGMAEPELQTLAAERRVPWDTTPNRNTMVG